SSRRRHTRFSRDWSSDVCSSDLHFLPLLYTAGLASVADRPVDTLVEGYAYGSLSMTSYTLGARCPGSSPGGEGAAPLETDLPPRSEERRVGKEWRSGWPPWGYRQ